MELLTPSDLSDMTSNADCYRSDAEGLKMLMNEKHRAEFEKMAINAAREGVRYVVTKHLGSPVEYLLKQGFDVQELVRQKDLLNSLEMAAESAEQRAILTADRFIFNNPRLSTTEMDLVSHRNPLFSLVCSLWDQGRITEETNTLEFESILKNCSNLKDEELLRHRFLLKSMIDDLKSFKMAENLAEPIRHVHALLPPDEHAAFKVGWNRESADNDLMLKFSPELLTWYSNNWLQVIDQLNLILESSAGIGLGIAAIDITTHADEISFSNINGFFDYFSVKCLPLIHIFSEFRTSGFAIAAEITHFDGNDPLESYAVNTMYDFTIKENDTLTLWIGWEDFYMTK